MERDPAADLRAIATCLERALEPTYRVKAFRTAAAVVDTLGAADLRRRAAQGTLGELTGIGKVTALVITESLAGEEPNYLRRVASLGEVPVSEGASALQAALQGDCHVHSDWSDGGAAIDVMARTARDLGHEYLVLTDHSARLTVANGLERDRLLRQLDVVAELNEELGPFRLLTGIEVDILDDGRLDADDDVLARLDVVVASVHSKLRMDAKDMTRRMCTAVANPHVDVLGHCTGRIVVGRGRSSTPNWSSTPASASAPPSRSTAAPSVSTRPDACSTWRSSSGATSPSTPTLTPPASSSGRPTAATAPPSGACPSTG
jgi:putative hydrolase